MKQTLRPPKPAPVEQISLPEAEHLVLPNGTTLHLLPAEGYDVVRVSFVFRAGTVHQRRPFAASATANLLAEGNARIKGSEIAERLDFLGSYYDVSIDRDCVYLNFASLSRFFPQTLATAAEILLRPGFPEDELRTYCAKRRHELTVERTKVETEAREAFARGLFGPDHPYGVSYPAECYDSLGREDLTEHYRRLYTADNGFVVCSGRIGTTERTALADLAAQLPRGERAEASFPSAHPTRETRIAHPGAVQSSIRVGRLLFPRQHPDFVGMQVVAALLGGYFGSRLMRTLREERGYTYGISAAMLNFERAGYFALATQVGREVTEDALRLIYDEIERLRTEPVPEEELALVRHILSGEMLRILDGPFGIADATIENILCGTDNAIVAENLRRIRRTTPDEVQRLAVRYLQPEELVTVVVGDFASRD